MVDAPARRIDVAASHGDGKGFLERLPLGELRVVEYVVKGLVKGLETYGPLHSGKRRWLLESAEEERDRVVYELAWLLDQAGKLPELQP